MQRHEANKIPVMEVRGLSFAYGKNRVLSGASFRIREGEITTVMGANGCGKTTLFHLMTRNLEPGRGGAMSRKSTN